MSRTSSSPCALTIAGSDSGGGAGIQADLKSFAVLGVFGTSALTCVTAQNPQAVTGVMPVSVEMVGAQIDAVCACFDVGAVKTGMLYSAAVVEAVAAAVRRHGLAWLVADPVMVASSGARLLQPDAVESLCASLLPLARLITPNVPEAELLCGRAIASVADMRRAARTIAERFGAACVVKGGHLDSAEATDVLFDGGQEHLCSCARHGSSKMHGTGCTYSAAVTALLARGVPLHEAVRLAKQFVANAHEAAVSTGSVQALAVDCEANRRLAAQVR
ncbi:MAG: bifunctional hydroxymethylpyrimidine kinase/phosphomethylpyrimidine kinase [Kiritimatiellae bacterium]|nr:bifunctional hydroxymethylpyrimidine kinase/phosphomethylpyrimidine kinase [Kiritimatiellia bacterium]